MYTFHSSENIWHKTYHAKQTQLFVTGRCQISSLTKMCDCEDESQLQCDYWGRVGDWGWGRWHLTIVAPITLYTRYLIGCGFHIQVQIVYKLNYVCLADHVEDRVSPSRPFTSGQASHLWWTLVAPSYRGNRKNQNSTTPIRYLILRTDLIAGLPFQIRYDPWYYHGIKSVSGTESLCRNS